MAPSLDDLESGYQATISSSSPEQKSISVMPSLDDLESGYKKSQMNQLSSEANFGQKAISGALNGVVGLGDLYDLASKIVSYGPNKLQELLTGQSAEPSKVGDSIKSGVQNTANYISGLQGKEPIPDITKIAPDSYAYKAGSYLPGVLMGGEGLLADGAASILPNAAKILGTDALVSGGGYVGQKIGDQYGHPVIGEVLGAGGAGLVPSIAESLLSNSANSTYNSLVGADKIKSKLGGFLDAEGNIVPQAVEGGSQFSKADPLLDTLKEKFYPQISFNDTPKSVSNKLSLFKQEAGADLSNVIDKASEIENSLFNSSAPSQNAQYLKMTAPDFSNAQNYIDGIADPSLKSTLQKTLDNISNASENGFTVSDFKDFKSSFGQSNSKSFNPLSNLEDTAKVNLNNKIYGALADSTQGKIDLLGQAAGDNTLSSLFSDANKRYSAASTFEPKAFQASQVDPLSKLKSDFTSLPGIAKLAAGGYLHAIPGVTPVIGAERTLSALTDVAPVQVAKTAESLGNVANFFNNANPSKGEGLTALLASLYGTTPDVPTQAQPPISSIVKSIYSNPQQINSEQSDMKNNKGVEITTQGFDKKLNSVANNLEINPEDLKKAISFETGGTFDSSVKNKAGSGATGLIQFMPATAKELTGASTKEAAVNLLSSMSPEDQLTYVEKYLQPYKGKIKSLDDLYMAILYPKAIGKEGDYPLFKEGSTAYDQNIGLDLNDDKVITKAEAASKVRSVKI
jgi:hypothetical protein